LKVTPGNRQYRVNKCDPTVDGTLDPKLSGLHTDASPNGTIN